MIRNRLHIILALAFAVAVSVSCAHREKLEPEPAASSKNQYSDKVTFTLGTAASVSPQTKAAAPVVSTRKFLCVQGNDSIYITSSVTDNLDPLPGLTEPAVKGAAVTTSTLENFYISANFDETLKYIDSQHIGPDNKVTVDGQTIYDTGYYWPQQSLDFYATNFSSDALQAASSDAVAQDGSSVENYNASAISWTASSVSYGYGDDDKPQVTFEYSLPVPDNQYKNDAVNQPDYVFAIASDRVESEGVVPLDFAHCFSAITFKLGNEFLNESGRQVKEVAVSGVPSAGVCTITPADAENALNFIWDTEGVDRLAYRQSIPAGGDGADIPNNTVINDGELTFMLIPHLISDDAQIEFVFNLHDGLTSLDGTHSYEHEWSVKVKLSEITSEWLPGKKYTYSLSGEEIVDVEVQDEFISTDPMVKGNLSITNTGNVPVYVRAYIVGWWENSEGIVVAPWTKKDGEWSGAAWEKGTSNWMISEKDGFFYHKVPVEPGQTTEKLFDTYTLTAVSPNPDARLILNVVTQAVLHYQVEQAWPQITSGVGISGFRVDNTGSYW